MTRRGGKRRSRVTRRGGKRRSRIRKGGNFWDTGVGGFLQDVGHGVGIGVDHNTYEKNKEREEEVTINKAKLAKATAAAAAAAALAAAAKKLKDKVAERAAIKKQMAELNNAREVRMKEKNLESDYYNKMNSDEVEGPGENEAWETSAQDILDDAQDFGGGRKKNRPKRTGKKKNRGKSTRRRKNKKGGNAFNSLKLGCDLTTADTCSRGLNAGRQIVSVGKGVGNFFGRMGRQLKALDAGRPKIPLWKRW